MHVIYCCFLQPAVATGWGSTDNSAGPYPDVLREVTVTVWPKNNCNGDWLLCSNTPGKSPCFGDSGGPLVFEERNGRYTLIGTVQGGPDPCADPRDPAIFVRVTSVLDWIKREIASVGICNTSPPPPPSPTPPPPSPTPPPTGNCMTVSGPSPGMQCIFPFTIGGITHTACTTQHSDPGDLPWCSTQVDANGNHVQERHFYL